jgi:hypothetical protein
MNGSDCSTAPNGECRYPDGTFCSCGTFAGPKWVCFVPGGDCPALVPNAGTPCSAAGKSCGYEGCKLEVSCMAGVWQWLHVAC